MHSHVPFVWFFVYCHTYRRVYLCHPALTLPTAPRLRRTYLWNGRATPTTHARLNTCLPVLPTPHCYATGWAAAVPLLPRTPPSPHATTHRHLCAAGCLRHLPPTRTHRLLATYTPVTTILPPRPHTQPLSSFSGQGWTQHTTFYMGLDRSPSSWALAPLPHRRTHTPTTPHPPPPHTFAHLPLPHQPTCLPLDTGFWPVGVSVVWTNNVLCNAQRHQRATSPPTYTAPYAPRTLPPPLPCAHHLPHYHLPPCGHQPAFPPPRPPSPPHLCHGCPHASVPPFIIPHACSPSTVGVQVLWGGWEPAILVWWAWDFSPFPGPGTTTPPTTGRWAWWAADGAYKNPVVVTVTACYPPDLCL